MTNEPRKGPALRVLAALMFVVFVALAITYFPYNGIPPQWWQLSPLLGAAVGATYSGALALTGRWLPLP